MLRIDPWPDQMTREEFVREQLVAESEKKLFDAGFDGKAALLIAKGRLQEDPVHWDLWEDTLKLSYLHVLAMVGDEKSWKMEYLNYIRNLD